MKRISVFAAIVVAAASLLGCKTGPSSALVDNKALSCPSTQVLDLDQLAANSALPNPFITSNGKILKTKKDWACRRAEIAAQAQTYQLGTKPSSPEKVTAEVQGENLMVTVTDNGKTTTFAAKIILPKSGKAPYPAIIGMGGSWLNNDELAKQGVAIIQFPNNDIAEQLNSSSRGKGKFYELYGADHSAGALMAWAWGVSRLIDALESTPDSHINANRLGVTGCSRNGKGALVAGAFDERIKLTIPQESGSGGSASWRVSANQLAAGQNVQTLAQIVQENVWFTDSFKQFSHLADRLPYDQHSLMGMVAPRNLLLIENTSMEWLGNRSAYTSALAAKEIWISLSANDKFGFSQVGGHNHCQLPESQVPIVSAFIRKVLLEDESADTNIFKSDGEYNVEKSRWINWQTPKLK